MKLRLESSWIFVVLWLMHIKDVCHALEVQRYPDGLTARDAKDKCGESGLENDPLVLKKITELYGHAFWTGLGKFTQLTPWIEILGCFPLSKKPSTKRIVKSVGYCQRECSTTGYFTYNKEDSACSCLNKNENQFTKAANLSSCLLKPTKPVLVYEIYNGTTITSSARNQLCTTLTCVPAVNMRASPCKGNYNIYGLCEDGIQPSLPSSWGLSQNQTSEHCWHKDKLLLHSNACQYLHFLTRAWTNVFREEIEVERLLDDGTAIPEFCLSANMSDNGILTLHRQNCSSILEWFVCKKVNPSQELLRTDSNGITWVRAQGECEPYGLENREEYLREIRIPYDHEFWIGKAIFRVPTRWIEIIDYNGTVSMSSDPGNCTTICCGNCNTITENGNNLEGRNCSSNSNTIVGRCGPIQKLASTVFKWELNYYDSLNHCMTRNALLTSSNYCQKIETSDFKGQLSWTNVFREEIEILQMKDFDGQPQRCFSGIFIKVKGQTILNITEQQCSVNKNYYVCKTNTEVKTQRPLFTHNKGMTEDASTSPDLLSSHEKEKSSYRSTAYLYSTETVLHNGQREKGNNSILTGAVIGGIISACSILAVIAALIACKIRSNGLFKESDTFEKGETSQLHFSNTINQDSTNKRKRKVNDLCETSASEDSVVNNLVFHEKK